MNKLTVKQKRFIQEYTKSGNGVQSVKKVYNVKDYSTAGAIASENLKKPKIKQAIDKILQEVEYQPKQSIQAIINVQEDNNYKMTADAKLKAAEMMLKLSGYIKNEQVNKNLNYNIDALDINSVDNFVNKFNRIKNNRK